MSHGFVWQLSVPSGVLKDFCKEDYPGSRTWFSLLMRLGILSILNNCDRSGRPSEPACGNRPVWTSLWEQACVCMFYISVSGIWDSPVSHAIWQVWRGVALMTAWSYKKQKWRLVQTSLKTLYGLKVNQKQITWLVLTYSGVSWNRATRPCSHAGSSFASLLQLTVPAARRLWILRGAWENQQRSPSQPVLSKGFLSSSALGSLWAWGTRETMGNKESTLHGIVAVWV